MAAEPKMQGLDDTAKIRYRTVCHQSTMQSKIVLTIFKKNVYISINIFILSTAVLMGKVSSVMNYFDC